MLGLQITSMVVKMIMYMTVIMRVDHNLYTVALLSVPRLVIVSQQSNIHSNECHLLDKSLPWSEGGRF